MKKQIPSHSRLKHLFYSLCLIALCVNSLKVRAQTATDGDYRTAKANGNWSDSDMWEVRSGGAWVVTGTPPSLTNNIYVQIGHEVTIDVANADVKDLNIQVNGIASPGHNNGIVYINANILRVSGKIRAYTGTTVTGAADGVFYTQLNSAILGPNLLQTSGSGVLRFIGSTRNVTTSGEWSKSILTSCAADFALTSGQIGTFGSEVFFTNIVISSGTFSTAQTIACSGDFTIKTGATFSSAKSNSATGMIGNSTTAPCGTLTIESGAVMECTGQTPNIGCTSFVNNGTVSLNRAGTQYTLLKGPYLGAVGVTQFNYTNLTLGSSNTKTLATNATLSGTLQINGTATLALAGTIPPAAGSTTQTLTLLNGSTIVKNTTSGTTIPTGILYGTAATDIVNVIIATTSSSTNNNEILTTVAPGKVNNLTINSSVTYSLSGSRSFKNLINNGTLTLSPSSTLTVNLEKIITTGVINGHASASWNFISSNAGSAGTLSFNLGSRLANGITLDLSGTNASLNLDSDLVVGGNFNLTAGNLIVNTGKSLTVDGNVSLPIAGTLTLENNANLVQTAAVNGNTGSGNAIVKRNSNPLSRLDYTLWSSPVASQNLLTFSPATTTTRFYNFNTTYNTGGVNGAFSAIDPSINNFGAGLGYLIRMPNTAVDAPATETFNGQFSGVPNNGDIPVNLVDGGAAGLRYNLVGNPYSSPISLTTFVNDNTFNIESTLYFWRKTNGVGTTYCTWVPGVSPPTGTFVTNGNTQSVDPLGVLQTGQGFFVEAKSGASSLTFKNSQRVANTAGQFFRTKQVAADSRIWLNATNASGDFSQMAVTYNDIATIGVDMYDGKYINDSAFALTSKINNGEYTIQGRPAFSASDVVALNFKTAVAGDYTIAIDHTDGVFATGQDVYLVDSKTGTETNLNTSSYTFTAANGVDNARFSLKYQKTLKVNAAAFNDANVMVYKNKGTLYVNSTAKVINSIRVYDVQGRLIAEQKNVKTNTATISNLKVDNQVLIVKVTRDDNSEVTKKVLN